MKLKFKIIAAVLLLFACIFGIESINAAQYEFKVVSINDGEPIYADGMMVAKVKVQVLKKGKGVKGHEIFAMAYNGGRFLQPKLKTDENGFVTFEYQVYAVSKFVPLVDVDFRFEDNSNSKLIRVNAAEKYTVKIHNPKGVN